MTKIQFAYWLWGILEATNYNINKFGYELINDKLSKVTTGVVNNIQVAKFVDDLSVLMKYTKTYDLFEPFILPIIEQFTPLISVLDKGDENIPVMRDNGKKLEDFFQPPVAIRPYNIPLDTTRIIC